MRQGHDSCFILLSFFVSAVHGCWYLTGDWNIKEETLGSGGFDQTISTVIWHLMQLIINDFTTDCAITNPKSPCCPTVRARRPAITSSSAQLHRFFFTLTGKKFKAKLPQCSKGKKKILVSKPFSSHGLVHTTEGKEWAEITASLGYNLCLVNSSKIADTAVRLT